jgi:formylglycine-generating enzyme required for sulfatase activity
MGRSEAGSDAFVGGVADEQPEHAVTVSSFQLNAFEVTVGRFRKFVDAYTGPPAAGAGAHPRIAGSGWNAAWNANMPADAAALRANVKCAANTQWTDAAGANEARPMNCANWYEAFAFCAWDGARLPTEAEFEYAAAGGSENRLYPWGSATPTTTLASFALPLGSSPELAGSVPAGNGRWGHRDLAGSLNEWALDGYDAAWYTGVGATCADCANLGPSTQRVYRGGYFGGIGSILRGAARGKGDPASHTFAFATGFRCARSL